MLHAVRPGFGDAGGLNRESDIEAIKAFLTTEATEDHGGFESSKHKIDEAIIGIDQ